MCWRVQPLLHSLFDWIGKASVKCDVLSDRSPFPQMVLIGSVTHKLIVQPSMTKKLQFRHVLGMCPCDRGNIRAPSQQWSYFICTQLIQTFECQTLDLQCIYNC